MLSDTARKLLLIINHSSGHHKHMPTLQELEIKSGRTLDKIRSGLLELVAENYIQWSHDKAVETAIIIESWERDNPAHKQYQAGGRQQQGAGEKGNIDYWTHY